VLEKEDALPGAQHHVVVGDGNAELRRSERALDVGGHVVRSLGIMAICVPVRSELFLRLTLGSSHFQQVRIDSKEFGERM